MLRARMLEALERAADRETQIGLDREGVPAWRRSGRETLAAVGAWQARLATLGVRRGERVAIDVPRGPDLLPAHLAALAAGCAVVPLNPALASGERERVLARAEVRVLLDGSEGPGRAGPPRLIECNAADPALLVFTSGTTGEPKGVPLTEANLEANLAALTEVWRLAPSDRLLHALPAHHVHGLVLALYGSVRLGIPIVMLERFDAELCLHALERHAIRVFMGVPTMYHRMLGAAAQPDLSAMRLFVSGSAPLSPHDFRGFAERFGHEPVERYGLTETIIVASNPFDGERRPGTVGHPLRQTEVRLARDGEIEVRGPAVMAGYWRAPELSAEVMVDGFFRTGDLGRFDAAGHLCIVGRKKELILVGGSNVVPGEVERALEGEVGVEELAVAGLPDPDRGEIVAAFIVARADEAPAAIEQRLRARSDAALAPYKRPRAYRFLGALPRNAMGKVDRQALRTAFPTE